MFSVLLLQAASLAASATPAGASLEIEGDYLTLAHLAAPGDIPPSIGRDFRLLKRPDGARSIVLTLADQERLLRRRFPALQLAPRARRDLRVTFAPTTHVGRGAPCFALNQPVAALEPIARAQADEVPCDAAKARARLGYDREADAPVATASLSAGSYLGPVLLPAVLARPRGAEMTLRTRVGPVTIDRSARLVQPGRAGRSAFVALSDGRIVAARLAAEPGDSHDRQ